MHLLGIPTPNITDTNAQAIAAPKAAERAALDETDLTSKNPSMRVPEFASVSAPPLA